jgi:murein DD-endopeptidase MepM/ murein hydrolase activator NlpD
MTINGDTRKFYRFRTPDDVVDYYDEQGNSAKKFLMRNPVRGGRFTSGFGDRRHPLLKYMRMHNGVDWAAPTGTPIAAAGDGTVEQVGGRGGYGNYVRLRHANGFSTAYGHMSRYAAGVAPGVTVKQGQIIGYVGSTGLSTGPHLHFEVLVNNSYVNPMTIQVPRGLQLTGRQLAEFQRERRRIETLMELDPVTSRVAQATTN